MRSATGEVETLSEQRIAYHTLASQNMVSAPNRRDRRAAPSSVLEDRRRGKPRVQAVSAHEVVPEPRLFGNWHSPGIHQPCEHHGEIVRRYLDVLDRSRWHMTAPCGNCIALPLAFSPRTRVPSRRGDAHNGKFASAGIADRHSAPHSRSDDQRRPERVLDTEYRQQPVQLDPALRPALHRHRGGHDSTGVEPPEECTPPGIPSLPRSAAHCDVAGLEIHRRDPCAENRSGDRCGRALANDAQLGHR